MRLRAERGFADPRALKDTGDRESHEFLISQLTAYRPGEPVLSEEGHDASTRLCADRVWIVDPLDGTREFGEEGRTDWAVHVALWERDRLAAGAVALPAQDKTLATGDDDGAIVQERNAAQARPLRARGPAGRQDGRPPRVAVSRTRPPEFLRRLADHMDLTFVPIGSAGAKISAVLLGEVDAYIHAGGQYEWDSAAPAAVALAAGVHASRIDGSALEYNQKDPTLPDILVCQPELAPTLLAGIRTVTETSQTDAGSKS